MLYEVITITEFVLAESIRRSATRSLLFVAPGEMLAEAVGSGLRSLRDGSGQTAISVLGEPPKQRAGHSEREEGNSGGEADDSETSMVQWVSGRALGSYNFV